MEFWADIAGFEGKYQISTEGQVMSLNYNNTGEAKILKPYKDKQGHLEVTLNKNDKHYYRIVSRLVLETFLGIKLSRNDIIMYKDGDKTHCSLDNMFLITRGKRQEITYDLDRRYRPKYEYYGEELPTKEIAKRNNINPKTVRNRVRELYWNIYEARRNTCGYL